MNFNHLDERALYRDAMLRWGAPAQIGMFVEEIGEVLVAVNKINRRRNGISEAELIEELVDLQIMLNQMKIIYGFSESRFKRIKNDKLKRLKALLSQEKP